MNRIGLVGGLGVALLAAAAVQAQSAAPNVCGHTIVRCKIIAAGAMTACSVVAEDPPGRGLGDATLKLTAAWRAPSTTANGASTVGAVFERWVSWPLSPGQSCDADAIQADPMPTAQTVGYSR
jgi:hypothetical protein